MRLSACEGSLPESSASAGWRGTGTITTSGAAPLEPAAVPVKACAGLVEQRLSYRRRREQPEYELLDEFVDGIGDDPQLTAGPTSSAEVAPGVVARPGEQRGTTVPAVDSTAAT